MKTIPKGTAYAIWT
ncbi:hypothetical protein [Bacillus sp. 105MF]